MPAPPTKMIQLLVGQLYLSFMADSALVVFRYPMITFLLSSSVTAVPSSISTTGFGLTIALPLLKSTQERG